MCVKVPDWARARDVRVDIRRSRVSVAVVNRRADGDQDNGNGNRSGNGNNVGRNEGAGVNGCAGSGLIDDGGGGGGGASASSGTPPSPPAATAGHHHPQQHEDASSSSNNSNNGSRNNNNDDHNQKSAPGTSVLLSGGLSRPVQVDECLWTMERAGRVLLYLQKELPADGEPGFEWWASVMKGDPEVDVATCDAGSDASKYPEHAKRRGARALWEHQNKSPEEKLNEVC